MNDFHIIIPARYNSTRLPGKLLLKLGPYTILQHVFHASCAASPKSIIIATDDERIYEVAKSFHHDVRLTLSTHRSGTERISEVVKNSDFHDNDIIVNVQGDEPFIGVKNIQEVALCLIQDKAVMVATLCYMQTLATLDNPNIVKVVRDNFNNALYFSRSLIPYQKTKEISFLRHIGLYAYRASFLRSFSSLKESYLENLESLEQLKILSSGYKIKVLDAIEKPLGDINSKEDFKDALNLYNKLNPI